MISLNDSFGAPKTSKTHFALKLSLYIMFCLNRAFEELFLLLTDSSKVVWILNVDLHIYYIIISLKDSLGAPTSLKKSLHAKTKSS